MKFRRNKRVLKVGLELTSLVDIVFLLLLFFALSSSFILRPGIRINLPLSSFRWGEEKERIVMSLTYDHILFLDNQRVSWEELPQELHSKVLKMERPILIIRADEKSMHGEVIRIMDIARETGIDNLAIATQLVE